MDVDKISGQPIVDKNELICDWPIMNFPDQDRQCFVTLSASFGSIAMGRQMLRCAQHDRTGFDWEKSSSGPDWPIMNMNKESATEEEMLRFPFASLRASARSG